MSEDHTKIERLLIYLTALVVSHRGTLQTLELLNSSKDYGNKEAIEKAFRHDHESLDEIETYLAEFHK